MVDERRNWSGNQDYGAARLHHPATVAEVQALVTGASAVRAVGSRHSFTGVAATPGDLLLLDRLDRVLAIDPERRTVTVEAGIRYGQLGPHLHAAGFALHNTASLPHITVGGACATATHGSGVGNGNLATAVSALELVTADGELVTLSRERDGDLFCGAVVGLGGLGVVATLTLDLVRTFTVAQTVYENLPLTTLVGNFAAIMAGGYSVSLFTDWRADRVKQVWVKRHVAAGAAPAPDSDYFGAAPADGPRHLAGHLATESCTQQLGVPGPWHERLPHFRPDGLPLIGAELQSEYFVPREDAPAIALALAALGERLAPVMQSAEVRTIAADDFWLSPCYQRDSVAFHFTWHPDVPAVLAALPLIEAQLDPFGARPHWGKLFTTTPARLRELYPRLPDFAALQRRLDPAGKFRNAFLDQYLLGTG
jgi:xylitol oxidase